MAKNMSHNLCTATVCFPLQSPSTPFNMNLQNHLPRALWINLIDTSLCDISKRLILNYYFTLFNKFNTYPTVNINVLITDEIANIKRIALFSREREQAQVTSLKHASKHDDTSDTLLAHLSLNNELI